MTAAFDLFDAKVDLEKLARRAQHAQTFIQNFCPDAVTRQSNDVIGLFRHKYERD